MKSSREPGSEVAVTVSEEGVTLYCNRRALRSMARYLQVMAEADPEEHYHMHIMWHLLDHRGETPGAFVLFDSALAKVYPQRWRGDPGFDVTFMAMPERELRKMRPRGRRGRLPKVLRPVAGNDDEA
jgi:hypothetical protein